MTTEAGRAGRPRSERARLAVLHAVDDLLVEQGYAALTMKSIAERAGVGRQTVYRWWSTKAEVLFDAAITDAAKELTWAPPATTVEDVAAYLDAVDSFLTRAHAGAAYRALIGEAQHDPAVARLMTGTALFDAPVRTVLTRAVDRGDLAANVVTTAFATEATTILTGPALYRTIAMNDLSTRDNTALAPALLAAITTLAGG